MIDVFSKGIEYLRKNINPNMPLQQVSILTHLYAHDKVTMKHLAYSLNISQCAVSRNISSLEKSINNIVNKGYVVSYPDPDSRRQRLVELTDIGREILDDLTRKISS